MGSHQQLWTYFSLDQSGANNDPKIKHGQMILNIQKQNMDSELWGNGGQIFQIFDSTMSADIVLSYANVLLLQRGLDLLAR